jgi:hypothetical protein
VGRVNGEKGVDDFIVGPGADERVNAAVLRQALVAAILCGAAVLKGTRFANCMSAIAKQDKIVREQTLKDAN